MSSLHRDRHDTRRPTFRDHRTSQFGGGERRHQNPAHYPQRKETSPFRRSTGISSSPIRRHNDQRHKLPEVRTEHHRSDQRETKEAVVTSSSATAAASSGSSRGATSSTSRRNEGVERRREAEKDEKSRSATVDDRRKDRTDRSRSSNVAARIQAPVVTSSSSPHHRHHQDQRNDWKKPVVKRPQVDNRPMSYATGASSSSAANSTHRKRHSSGDRQKSSSDSKRRSEEKSDPARRHGEKSSSGSTRRHGDDKDKDRRPRQREDEKKKDGKSSSSSRRREGDGRDRKTEKSKEAVKEEDRIVNENREEDEAVAIQGLIEVDSCEDDENPEQAPRQDAIEQGDAASEKSGQSPPASNGSVLSDSEEELDYEEEDIDIDLGDDIDVETMKAAVKGDLKVDDTEDEMDENDELHEMKDDDEDEEEEEQKHAKGDEPEKKRARTEEKDDKEKRNGSASSKSHRRRDENKDVPSSSDRKERRRSSRSPARQQDTDRKQSRRNERISTTERSSQREGAGTEIQRIPSLLTMRIAAPPGIKKLETLNHSSVGTSSHSSEGFGETFSNRWCQCSCAHHMPSTSTAGSLDASPASTSSSNSDASVPRIPSLMSLRTPFNNSCLFLAPPQPPARRMHEPAARIRAPSPPRRFQGDCGFQRMDDHRGGRGGGQIRQRTPDRMRRDDRRGSTFDDRKRMERGPIDNGRRRSPLRRRSSPPRGRPGEKVVQSYRNGV